MKSFTDWLKREFPQEALKPATRASKVAFFAYYFGQKEAERIVSEIEAGGPKWQWEMRDG